jgi:hypothetical protein
VPDPGFVPARQGSETRQRGRRITFRVSDAEYAELEAAADAARLTIGSYVRERSLEAPRTQPRRRHSADHELLRRLYGQLARIGSNIHQLLRRVNFGDTPPLAEYPQAITGLGDSMDVLREALGQPPRAQRME